MAVKVTADYGNNGVTVVTKRGDKAETLVFDYVKTLTDDAQCIKAMDAAEKAEVSAYRGAIRFVLLALQKIPHYAGMGVISESIIDPETGESKPGPTYRRRMGENLRKASNGYKSAFRQAASEVMMPALKAKYPKDASLADADFSAKLAAGSFANAASIARKFFWLTGKLPCAYDNAGTPDISRALSAAAMQKIMVGIEEQPGEDLTYAARVSALMAEWADDHNKKPLDRNTLAAMLGFLDQFSEKVQHALNMSDAAATNALLALNTPSGDNGVAKMAEVQPVADALI